MTTSTRHVLDARWIIPLAIAALAVLLQVAGGAEAWRLERAFVATEPWRLVTGHFVHLGWPHLALNLAGFGIVWALFGRALSARQWLATMLVCAAGVSLGLLWLSPGLEWYVGLSGTLHGLLAAAVLRQLLRRPDLVSTMLLLGFVAKLGWEQWAGGDPDTARLIGDAVVVDAHLYGALTGATLGCLFALARRSAA